MTPFDIANDISMKKEDLIRSSENPELTEKKIYNAFIINRHFSHFIDSILYVNEINQHHSLPNLLQHDYLINSLRGKKRFSKWHKKSVDENVSLISEYFSVNTQIAIEYLDLMSDNDLENIKIKMQKGGTDDKNRRSSRS